MTNDKQNPARDVTKEEETTIITAEVSFVLCVSKSEAIILLLYHDNCSVNKVNDAWFADESGVLEKVGLVLRETSDNR